MSKALEKSVALMKQVPNFASKFSPSAAQGSRILPNKTLDAQSQVRIDAGYFDPSTKELNVTMQVNSEAKSQALVNFRNKHSSHGKLATATFKTDAADQKAEADRVLEELKTKAVDNLG